MEQAKFFKNFILFKSLRYSIWYTLKIDIFRLSHVRGFRVVFNSTSNPNLMFRLSHVRGFRVVFNSTSNPNLMLCMCFAIISHSFIHSFNFQTFVRSNVDLVGRSLIRWLIRLVRICYVLLFLFCASSFTRCSFVIVIAVSHFPLEQPFIICNEWKEIEREERKCISIAFNDMLH